jgi:predicted nucleotidyltransferase
MESDEIISILRENRAKLARFKVKHLWLFGSSSRGEPANDLDFLVSFESLPGLEDFMGLKFFLEDLLGQPVDLLSRSRCPDRLYARIEDDLVNVA